MKAISKELLAHLRKRYPAGTRVQLLRMNDPQAPPVGTKGTVLGIDDIGSIMVNWDNGSGLNLVYGEDTCKIIDDQPDKQLAIILLQSDICSKKNGSVK